VGLNGKLHRDNNLPAVVQVNGDKRWYIDGFLHRGNDLPAVILANGHKEWYIFGEKYKSNASYAIFNMASNMLPRFD
jgi:hypothetical protein